MGGIVCTADPGSDETKKKVGEVLTRLRNTGVITCTMNTVHLSHTP